MLDPTAPAGSRWSAGPALNEARGYITTAVLGKRVYAIGGDVNTAGQLAAQPIVESWTLGSPAWNDAGVADLPQGCDESQAFGFLSGSLANDVVLSSCGQWPNGLGTTYVYRAPSNAWTVGGAIKDVVRNEAGEVVTVSGRPQMFIWGGYDSASSFLNPTNVAERASAALGDAAGVRSSPAGAGSPRAATS